MLAVTRRVGEHQRYQDYWQVMRPQFDWALRYTFEELYDSGIKVEHFVRTKKKLLGMFMATADLDKILEAGDQFGSVASEVKRVCESSEVGKVMYRHALLQCSRALFQQEIQKQLEDLEHLDFEMDAVRDFRAAMVLSGNRLAKNAQSTFQRAKSTIHFLGADLSLEIDNMNMEWEYRLEARLKTIGVNSRALEVLPWESLLFDTGSITGVPQFCKVPAELFTNASAARAATLEYLGSGPMTLAEMVRIVNYRAKSLRLLDASFDLEVNFLNTRAAGLLIEKVHQSILASLPNEEAQPTMQQAPLGKIITTIV